MTGPLRGRVPLPPADDRVVARFRFAKQHQVTAAEGDLSGRPRDSEYGLVSLPQLTAHNRDGVAVLSLRGELDSFGTSVLQAHLSDIWWQLWARSVVDLAGLSFIDGVGLGLLVRRCREIRGRGGSFALAGPGRPCR
jgi:anti-anti-sigma factor